MPPSALRNSTSAIPAPSEPGNHAATGPIQLLSGLTVTANGQRIEWLRDTLDPYAFHLDIPAGVTSIDVQFQQLTQPDASNWRVLMTPAMVNLQWEKAILYPAGYFSRHLQRLSNGDKQRALVFYCRSDCWLSWNAVKRANALGYTRLYWYRDGLDAWENAGLPVHPATPEAFP